MNLSQERIQQLIAILPKAELHLHIEGTLEADMIFRLAQRNHVQLKYTSVQELKQAFAFTNLQSFLDLYYMAAAVLIHKEDFFELAWAYLLKAKQDNIVRTQIFFDPQTHTQRGIPIQTVIQGLSEACRKAKTDLGVSAQLILCFLRHLSQESAFSTLKQALPFREHFIGIGLDSSQVGNPPQKFAKVFQECRKLGFRVVAHAGEEAPPSYIWSAIKELGVERIDHGVQSIKDQVLVSHLIQKQIPLTVCPFSNLELKVFQKLEDHSLAELLRKGVCVTINSDDPAYFKGYLNDNFKASAKALKLSGEEVVTLARNSIQGSFWSQSQKKGWLQKIEETRRLFE